MNAMTTMTLIPRYSSGDSKMLALAAALIDYAGDDRELLERMARGVWPSLRIYRGDTHWRFMPDGDSRNSSFYVDFSGEVNHLSTPITTDHSAENVSRAGALAAGLLCCKIRDEVLSIPKVALLRHIEKLEAEIPKYEQNLGKESAPARVARCGLIEARLILFLRGEMRKIAVPEAVRAESATWAGVELMKRMAKMMRGNAIFQTRGKSETGHGVSSEDGKDDPR